MIKQGKANLNWPLMENNISEADRKALITFLQEDKILTQSEQVQCFETAWSKWLGIQHSVFVNSGSSANMVTLAALKELLGPGEIILPPLTWVSDVNAVVRSGFKPVFVDINRRTLGLDDEQVIRRLNKKTKAVFLTHILGFNALTDKLLQALQERKIILIEDACESYGAMHRNQKVGTYGFASNFSFYYAHHLATIEGGMVSTNDTDFYEVVRMMRSHGLVRESTSSKIRKEFEQKHADLTPEFIFAYPGFNIRNTELNAVIGLSHLDRLDEEIKLRNRNLQFFLANLDPELYFTDFAIEGCSNYAFTLVLREADEKLGACVMQALRENGVEFRRGTSGGGNQLRQPYLKKIVGNEAYKQFPHVEHIHFYGFYIGNYPSLSEEKIAQLCQLLNSLKR